MRTLACACVVLAACMDPGPGSIELECFNGQRCESGALGIGGVVFPLVYRDGDSPDALFVTANATIALVKHDDAGLVSVVGVAPGTTSLLALDDANRVIAELPVVVEPVTAIHLDPMNNSVIDGPFVDATHDAAYRITGQAGVRLNPFVGPSRSIGTHFFTATVDGAPYNDCYQLECDGPIFKDVMGLFLDAGMHELVLHPTDGGRDFTFALTVQ